MLWETIITLTDKLKAERRAAISSEAWSALGKYENYVEIKAYLVLEFGIFGMKGLLKDSGSTMARLEIGWLKWPTDSRM